MLPLPVHGVRAPARRSSEHGRLVQDVHEADLREVRRERLHAVGEEDGAHGGATALPQLRGAVA